MSKLNNIGTKSFHVIPIIHRFIPRVILILTHILIILGLEEDQAVADQEDIDQVDSDRAVVDQADSDQADIDQADSDRAVADQEDSDRADIDTADSGQVVAGQAVVEDTVEDI